MAESAFTTPEPGWPRPRVIGPRVIGTRVIGPRSRRRRRPETGVGWIVALAWLALAARSLPIGLPGMATMSGMASHGAGGWRLGVPALADTTVMTVAMMGPATLGGVRHTAQNSLRWRRRRAMAEYATAYLSVWLAFGVAALAAVALLPQLPGQAALCAVLLAAAAWQFTPYKRRWLRDCHLSVPLPPRGWQAERAALAFGARNGLACLGSCWCLMLVMYAAPGGRLLWSIAITGVLLAERLHQRPGEAVRLAGVALGSAGLWSLIMGIS